MVRINAIIYVSAFVLMFCVGFIVSLLPAKMLALSATATSVGYLASAFALTFVVMQIPVGKLSEKFGIKSLLVSGYLVCASAGLFYFYSNGPVPVLLGRMCQGIGEIPVWSLAPALLAIQHPVNKGRFIGIYNAAVHIGLTTGSLGGLLAPDLVRGNYPFLIFSTGSLLGGLMVFLWAANPRTGPIKAKDGRKAGLTAILKTADLGPVFGGILLYGAGYGIFITMIPGFLIRIKGWDQASVSMMFTAFYMGIGTAQIGAGILSDRLGQKAVMAVSLMMAAAGMAFFCKFSLFGMLALLTISALGLGGFCVSALAFVNELVDDRGKGMISGVFYLYWGIGYFTAPILFGTLRHAQQWQKGFFVLGMLLAVECLVLCLFLKSGYNLRGYKKESKGPV